MTALPHPREIGIADDVLERDFVQIEIDRCRDPAWHYSIGLQRDAQSGPQGEVPPNDKVPLATLGLFHRDEPLADIEVMGHWLPREVHPADWLDVWVAQLGVTPVSSLPVPTGGGNFGDVVGTWDAEEGAYAGRFAALRFGKRLFVLTLRTPLSAYPQVADAFFFALATFQPLSTENDPPFAEELRTIGGQTPVPWETSLPASWNVVREEAGPQLTSVQAALDPLPGDPTPSFGQFTALVIPRSATEDVRAIAGTFFEALADDGIEIDLPPLREQRAVAPFETSWACEAPAELPTAQGPPVRCEIRCRVLRHPQAWVVLGVCGPRRSVGTAAWMQCARTMDLASLALKIG